MKIQGEACKSGHDIISITWCIMVWSSISELGSLVCRN